MNSSAVMTMDNSPDTKQFADELWISLVSLLRSHIAMHSIAQPAGSLRVLSSSKSEIVVLGSWGKLHIVGPDKTGECATEFRPELAESGDEYETFHFNEEGLIQFQHTNTAMDMETAVEYLLRKVQA
jgi:hypothetical protein